MSDEANASSPATPHQPASGGLLWGAGLPALVFVRALVFGHAPDGLDAAFVALGLLLLFTVAPGPGWRSAHVAVAAALVVGVVASRHPHHSLLTVPAALTPVVFFALGRAASPGARRRIAWAVVAAVCVHIGFAVYQVFVLWPPLVAAGPSPELPEATLRGIALLRPVGRAFSPDLYAIVCLSGACAALIARRGAPERRATSGPLTLALVVVAAAGALFSRSFGSVLTLAGALTLFIVLWHPRRWFALVPLLAAPLVFLGRGPAALATSAAERWANWRVALDVWAESPLSGVGLYRFSYVYAELRPPGTNETLYAHQGPLQLAAELGVLGVMATLVLVGFVAMRVWVVAREPSSSERTWRLAAAVGLLAVVAHGAIDYEWHVAQCSAVIGGLLGISAPCAEATRVAPRFRPLSLGVGLLVCAALTVFLSQRDAALARLAVGDAAPAQAMADTFVDDAPLHLALTAESLRRLRACSASGTRDCSATRSDFITARDAGLAITPQLPVALLLAAQGDGAMGDRVGALRFVDAALRRSPGNVSAHRLAVGFSPPSSDERTARIAAARRYGVNVDDIGASGPGR